MNHVTVGAGGSSKMMRDFMQRDQFDFSGVSPITDSNTFRVSWGLPPTTEERKPTMQLQLSGEERKPTMQLQLSGPNDEVVAALEAEVALASANAPKFAEDYELGLETITALIRGTGYLNVRVTLRVHHGDTSAYSEGRQGDIHAPSFSISVERLG